MAKLTRAALNALAYTYLTGKMPRYLREQTWNVVYNCIETRGDGYELKPECVAYIANHPQVLKVRELEADGWKIGTLQAPKVRDGVYLKRNRHQCCVYPDGECNHV